MEAFTDFILQVTYPPNPIRNLDNSLTPAQQAGRNTYMNVITDVTNPCNGCHTLDPSQGFFGTRGNSSFDGRTQLFKIPHLRNAYQKVGMFGMPPDHFVGVGDNDHKGDQVRGIGFATDGSTDTLFRFHGAFTVTTAQRSNIEQFVLAFDSNLAPIVGQQITLTNTNSGATASRIALLEQRRSAGECDLTVKGVLAGEQRGWLRLPGGAFVSDRGGDPPMTGAALRLAASPTRPSRSTACRRAPAYGSASIATRTARTTATSSTPAPILQMRTVSPPRRARQPRARRR